LRLTFTAFANQSYTLETASSPAGPWTPFQDVAPGPSTHLIQIDVSLAAPSSFFRLRTPWRFAEPPPLRFESFQAAPGNQVRLLFVAQPNRATTVEYRPNLTAGNWVALTNYPALPNARSLELLVPAPGAGGFYRLRSP
jgi:hypothetical protein